MELPESTFLQKTIKYNLSFSRSKERRKTNSELNNHQHNLKNELSLLKKTQRSIYLLLGFKNQVPLQLNPKSQYNFLRID